MKSIISKYKVIGKTLGVQLLTLNLYLLASASLTSCTSYLDKTADSDVSEEVAFENFTNFQGFVEEIYNCIPNKESCYWTTTFNWGEDEIMNAGEGDSHFSHQMDLGNYRNWMSNAQTYLGGYSCDPTSDNKFNHRTWQHAWYCIRKCNLGLENLDKMTNCTSEEKNLIAGQLYFFRAWWHMELMQYFGGLPYIDKVLDGATKLEEPRLSYTECAEKAAADLRKAADLLPNDWDKTTVGKKNLGHNDIYITKVCALGYLGKCYLWAASPLMQYGAEMNSSHSYDYNKELAQKAADALGEALNQVNSGATPYALAEYNYDDIYNHKASSSSSTSYDDIFYTINQNWKMPGTCEAVMRGVSQEANGSNWNFTKLWGSKVNSLVEHDKIIHMPTANYVNYAYGMANGKPAYIVKDGELVPNTEAGFDPEHPFENRDPRFYHDIIFDGERYVNTTIETTDADYFQQYFRGYSNSQMRDEKLGSRTGYFCQKLCDHRNNKFDGLYNWSSNEQCYLPYMRLADIYLMYAEAGAAVNGAQGKGTGCSLTSVDAINALRDRVGVEHVADEYTGDAKTYMDEVRRERACELSFEGFRWNDLQRWLLLTKAPYNAKYSQEFDRVEDDKFYEDAYKKDVIETTKTAQVKNWRMEKICDRQLVVKHYWFPFPDDDVYLYEGFPQNTGW